MKYPVQPSTLSTVLTRGVLAACLVTFSALPARPQSYTVVDLSPNAGNAAARGFFGGAAAGSSAAAINGTLSHAMLWGGGGSIDLHPSLLDDASAGTPGRSSVGGAAGAFQVGWGAGTATANRPVPMIWSGTAESARLLSIPFVNFGGQAHATDGSQVVGYAAGLDRDGTAPGLNRAMLWDAASGTAVDLGDGGNGAMAYGVGGGQQVGYVVKGQASAALWRGTARSLVVLHPKNAIVSVANATDGQRQVGYAGYDVRVRAEAAKGNKEARFNYAMMWNGTPESAANLHPYPVNSLPGVVLSHSFALGLQGGWIVGYAGDAARTGTPAYSHAIVWDASLQSVDLNAFLPSGFVGAQALAVNANGDVAGFMARADGTRHAVVWLRNVAP